MNAKFLRLLLIALLALCMGAVAACGDDDNSSDSGSTTEEAASTPEAAKIKVGMVTDIGGLNDRSFNEAAYKGLQKAESELGVEIRALTSKAPTDYVPNLTTLARQKYDLIIAVGFLMAEDTEKIANQFPDTKFAIIDSSQQAMKSQPKNLEGLLFKENEAGYLVGYMAGLYVKDKGGDQVVSTVGGLKIPPVDAYIAGFQKGARDANPKIDTLNGYSEDFVDQAKCKEIALNQIAEGSQVVFQVAGGCGLGALDAAKEKGVMGIGVDVDQAYLGDQVMTSALKKIDEAVFATIKSVQEDSYKGGTDQIFNVANGGAGFGKTNDVGAKYADKVNAIEAKIKSGEIKDIPTEVK